MARPCMVHIDAAKETHVSVNLSVEPKWIEPEALKNLTKYVVENSPGVLSFVGPKGSNPIPLKQNEIKRIFGEVEMKEGREFLTTSYKVGDSVKVIAGPFIDFAGNIEEVNDEKQKVKVVVSIFGRPTSVELDCFQVEHQK